MSSDRLFDLDGIPEVPLFREPPPGRGALVMDARIAHDYPPEWHRCTTCGGDGVGPIPDVDLLLQSRWTGNEAGAQLPDTAAWASAKHVPSGIEVESVGRSLLRARSEAMVGLVERLRFETPCSACLGMGSLKARVRLEAGHRCVRCCHPYIPKSDAKMLGVDPSPYHWSPCDERCAHAGPVRILVPEGDAPFETGEWLETTLLAPFTVGGQIAESGQPYEAEWRILTVHHLDGDKANLAWWNLAALCQRCHLEIQGKVVLERVYPHEHSDWFKMYVAGYYARVYLGEDLTREQTAERLDELLALERIA